MKNIELDKFLEEDNIIIDIDKEIEAMKRINCLYFTMPFNRVRLTIDLRDKQRGL